MNKRTLIALTLVTFVAVGAVPFVYAQGHHHGEGMGGMMMFEHLARAKDKLGLSDQQVTELKAIGESLKVQNAPYREQMHSGMLTIAQTLINNPNDLTTAQALIDRQTDTERTMKYNALAAASKALNVLTPDQRAKVAEFLAGRHARHAQR